VHPGPAGKVAIAVMLDEKPVGKPRGADVDPDGVARFDRAGMIRLLAGTPQGEHVLTLVANEPGLASVCVYLRPVTKTHDRRITAWRAIVTLTGGDMS
jgi:hypothetical protein